MIDYKWTLRAAHYSARVSAGTRKRQREKTFSQINQPGQRAGLGRLTVFACVTNAGRVVD